MGTKERQVLDAKKVAKLICGSWWFIKGRSQGVPLQVLDGDEGVWCGDGFCGWHLRGTKAQWMTLYLAADTVDNGAIGQAEVDFAKLVAGAKDGAVAISATNLLLRIGDKGTARLFVGPDDSVAWVDEDILAPLGDVMELLWWTTETGPRPIVGGTLTEDLCVVMPMYIPGQHRALARAWRSWNGEDLLDDAPDGRLQPQLAPDESGEEPDDAAPGLMNLAWVDQEGEHGA